MSKSQPLSKGAVLLQEKPFAYIVKAKFAKERCDFCLKGGKLLKCGGCQHSHYCSVLCQRDAWAEHKFECLCMKKIAPRVIPDAGRIMAKIIWKLQYGGYLQKFYYSRNGFRKFIDLMPHLHEIKWDKKRMAHVESLYAVLSEYLANHQLPNFAEFLGIYGRLCINGFNLLDEEMNSIGTAIYLATSIIDHSCRPNAVAIFNGPEISIRLIQDLPEMDWKNVKISYIDTMNLREVRRKELKTGYYFDCDCPKCLDESEELKMLAAACPNAECDAAIFCATMTKCPDCEADITDEHKQLYDDVTEQTIAQLGEMCSCAYIDMCVLLERRQRGVLHEQNLYRLKTLDLAFETALNLSRYEEAVDFGNKLLPGLKTYTFDFNPLIGLVHLKLGKVHLYTENLQMALHHLREGADVLKISHGDFSRLTKEHLNPLLAQAQKAFNKAAKQKPAKVVDSEEED